jgi:HK97 family phage major capsid protein
MNTKGKKPTVKDYNDLSESYKALNERVEAAEAKAKESEDQLKSLMAGGGAPNVHTRMANSDEQKALSYFGVNHVKDIFEVDTGAPQYAWVPEHLKGMVKQLKNDLETARAISQMFYGDGWDKIGSTEAQDRVASCKNIGESYFFKNVLAPKLKAFGTGVVGGGAEWVPTVLSSTYISEMELGREFVGMLKQVNMPQSPYELPTNGYTVARGGSEGVTATDSSFSTGKLAFSAKKFQEYYIFPEELSEDSAPDIVALGRNELTQAHLRAFETALINGDADGTHQDADTQAGAADLAEKQLDGLRKIALAQGKTVNFGAAVSDTKLREMRAAMGKFGVNPSDLVWVASAKGYLQMLGTNNVVTVDKMGPNATILKGQLGSYEGIPIVQSGFLRSDMDATGVNILPGDATTGMLLVHRPRLYWATRRPIRLAIRPSRSADDRIEMASYSRVDFQLHSSDFATGESPVVYGINIV